jgi:nucleoside-diphosphate-sugar epimerase
VKNKEWSDGKERFATSCSIADAKTKDMPTLIERIKMWKVKEEALTAFPAEAAEEELLGRDPSFFGEVVDDENVGDDAAEILRQEQEMLEELLLPGTPEHEKDRRKKWVTMPRPARATIRRMRTQFGHCPKAPLYEILKAAKCARVSRFVQALSL